MGSECSVPAATDTPWKEQDGAGCEGGGQGPFHCVACERSFNNVVCTVDVCMRVELWLGSMHVYVCVHPVSYMLVCLVRQGGLLTGACGGRTVQGLIAYFGSLGGGSGALPAHTARGVPQAPDIQRGS